MNYYQWAYKHNKKRNDVYFVVEEYTSKENFVIFRARQVSEGFTYAYYLGYYLVKFLHFDLIVQTHIQEFIDKLVVSGGGARNSYIMKRLKAELKTIKVVRAENSDFTEALGMPIRNKLNYTFFRHGYICISKKNDVAN